MLAIDELWQVCILSACRPIERESFIMSLESVRDHLASVAPDLDVIVTDVSSATVDLAAQAHGVAPGQIAKTLSFQLKVYRCPGYLQEHILE